MSRSTRIAGIVAAVVVLFVALYAVAGYWVVPALLPGQLRDIIADELGLEAHLEEASFDPFRLRLEVRGFAMGETLDAPDASLDALIVDLDVAPLLAGRVIVDELHLDGPLVVLRIDPDGGLAVAGVAIGEDAAPGSPAEDEAQPEPESDEPDEDGLLAELRIRRLALSNGSFRLIDASHDPALEREVSPIEIRAEALDLTNLVRATTNGDQPSPAEVVLGLGDGASLSARGDIDVDPLQLDLKLRLTAFSLASLQPYVAREAQLVVHGGTLDFDGHLQLGITPEAPEALRFAGDLGVSGLEVRERDGANPVLAWKQLDVRGIEIVSEPLAVEVGSVGLEAPIVHLVRSREGLNLARAFEGDTAEAAPPEAPGDDAPTVPVKIGPIEIRGGRLRFDDRSIEPAYGIDLADLKVTIDGFRTDPASRSKLDVAAEAAGYAPLTVSGSLAPLDPREFVDLRFAVQGLELESFSPYTGRYIGRRVDGGRGSLDIQAAIAKHDLTSQTGIVLQDLDFGASVSSAEATSLPVASAAALLADADGRIRIDVPISGDLDDPGFSYTGQLIDTLRTLITRVVATPFKLVNGMVAFGGRLFTPEDLRQIGFEAEDDDLSDEEATKLDALAQALRENPDLSLAITGTAAPDVDGDDDLRALARRRARAVQKYLEAAGIQADRLEIGEIDTGVEAEAPDGLIQTRLAVR